MAIPKILHFVWGYHPEAQWGVVEHLAVVSAARANSPGWEVRLWTPREPAGNEWAATCRAVPALTLCRPPPLEELHPHPDRVVRYQHKADLVRHWALLHLGGAYLDLDTLTFAPFPEAWMAEEYVVGLEYDRAGKPIGLPNCVFLTAPQAPFARRIHDEMRRFDGTRHAYAEFAVYRPYQWYLAMSAANRAPVARVVQWALLGPMHWDVGAYWDPARSVEGLNGVAVAHLWRTFHSAGILDSLTRQSLETGEYPVARAVQQLGLLSDVGPGRPGR